MACARCEGAQYTPSGAVKEAHIQSTESTEVRSWTALPLIDVNNVPNDLDLICGSSEEFKSWRIPAAYFLGGALNASKYTTVGTIDIEFGQVKPVFFTNDYEHVRAAKASDANNVATDIAIVNNSEAGEVTVMKNGYYTFSRPHMYEVGKTYYLSQTNAGEVVSVRPNAGIIQPLFTVVDQTTIAINVALY